MATNFSSPSFTLERRRSAALQSSRAFIQRALYSAGGAATNGKRDPLQSLANTFTRFAGVQTTYLDNGGSISTASGSSANTMERQVERAVAQALGRSGSGASFGAALNDAFPVLPNGRVAEQPARSVVSMYGTNGPLSSPGGIAAGLVGQLSVEQAALYRQASIVIPDARGVLASLTPYSPLAEADIVNALRALVDSELDTLLQEFGRVAEPRRAFVNDYFKQLSKHYDQLGNAAYLTRRNVPATILDESQLAGYELLGDYIKTLRQAWKSFDRNDASVAYPVFSQRTARAGILLDVISQSNTAFQAAMDSIGYGDAERSAYSSRLNLISDLDSTLPAILLTDPLQQTNAHSKSLPNPLALPALTLKDLTDWLADLSEVRGHALLTDSGQYGLEFVTLQADLLYRTIVPIVWYTTSGFLDVNGMPVVAQVLAHERVRYALSDLAGNLNALADLAA